MTGIELAPIGHVHSRYEDRRHTPVQAALNRDDRGEVVIDPPYRAGLAGLDGFDYAWPLCWFAPNPADPVPVLTWLKLVRTCTSGDLRQGVAEVGW
jgi:tRNA (Thr-GGU) A37 N-methylase